MSQCIYCGGTKSLNTSLTITLDDGVKHTVNICDEHAEDASIKSARAAFVKKQEQIKEVLEQAKALGLTVSENGGLVVAQAAEPKSEPEQPKSEPKPELKLDDGFVPTDIIDKNRSMTSVGGNTSMGNVPAYSSYDTAAVRGDLPEDALKGKVKMGVMEGREGQPIALPQQRTDGTGTTRINIQKTEDDRTLQDRFKKMAQSSIEGNTPDFAKSGYSNTTTTCPICRGDGAVKMGKESQTCPKCEGSGFISIY